MLKTFESTLKGLGYQISESTERVLVVYNLKNHLVVSITANNSVIIAKENNTDIRFKGIVDNAVQLKLILTCITRVL